MIKRIFELQNPWRSRVFKPSLKNRRVLKILLENLHNRKILGLIGSRQVGKSSLLYLIIEHLLQEGVRAINHWRTTNQTEIDFFVTRGNATHAIEVKWERDTPPKSFKTIHRYYPEIETRVVTRKGFLEIGRASCRERVCHRV